MPARKKATTLNIRTFRKCRFSHLAAEAENAIADLMDESVRLSAEADRQEDKATALAQVEIDKAIGLDTSSGDED
jgi:hypothetical protein